VLEDRFSSTSHVGKHRLAEMPPQKLIGYAVWICRIATDRIQTSAIDAKIINPKYDDLVVILLPISENGELHDYGNTHVRVHRHTIAVKFSVYVSLQQKAILTRIDFRYPRSDVPDPSPVILRDP
jgi:hypothetical protein